jgi:DNA-directed RNA polymerase II subunit RPB2
MAISGDESRELSRRLIDTYFRTTLYPYTNHHILSYDQFLQQDLISIVKSQNPVLILKDLINEKTNTYKYKVEIFIGGEDGTAIEIGTPTVSLQNTDEVRILFPNEARLRNLTYASQVYADIIVKITYTTENGVVTDLSPSAETFQKWPLFKIPIMLHSRYCILNNKPRDFLREVGECPYDNGGYFIIDGAEKVLITRQEQAFNTLYVTPQTEPKVSVYASISCLSAETRQVKRIAFALMRHVEKENFTIHPTIQVSLPFVRKTIPLFVLFRALGFQSDEEILRMIFPDFESPEAKLLLPKLQPSIIEAFPFLNTYTAIKYIVTLTKGFSIAHVLDIIKNQLFIHMPNDPSSQALFLGDCVRKILLVSEGYDNKTDRDDTRNQRCLTSGFLVQELFNNSYKLWVKAFTLAIDKEYNYNKKVLYANENFKNIFQAGNDSRIFLSGLLSDMIMKGFKGKWGTGLGEEKTGVLQAMSRLSYVDFMSHCRRVILDFDTGMKLTGPRKLHPSQYGYFCTSETPTGASIGITKNLSIMTAISTASQTPKFFEWLRTTGRVYKPEDVTEQQRITFVPVYVNGGMFGYTAKPYLLSGVLKALKRSGCLPYSVSISFSIRDRVVYIYMDAGRPLRPLIWLDKGSIPIEKLRTYPTWRDLVMGNLEIRKNANLETTEFIDPLAGKTNKLEDYPDALSAHTGAIEYVDPYEQNEAYIANNPAYIKPETTHMEVHPSTIMSMMTSLIPFAPHNQSPRNQLSCSQSKQGLSIYATNWRNRFDNTAHVLCYGEMPLTRTIYNNYLGEGKMAYGMNIILAIATWSGYNQEDGIVMNYDAIRRGMFRSMAFRSYELYEEDDEKAGTKVRFGNPALIGNWKDLKPGLDYSKLDERGIVKEGEYVDENTVIVGAYMMSSGGGTINDASKTPQVWTRGRVEKVVVMVNNLGLRLVKIRVVQDRMPELGDKFCLTDDHTVLTRKGWKNIAQITIKDEVCQLNRETNEPEWVNPLDTFIFNNSGDLYDFRSTSMQIVTTGDHRLWTKNGFIKAKDVRGEIIMGNQTNKEVFNPPKIIQKDCKVYCISVPSQVFLVKYKNQQPLWTGNSNRHGQKGTIGAMLRGYDMPRTESGLIPDMIMNPHAIPSRMTIAQNLEQLMGKTAALSGAIGDGTSFMNDGSPQEAIGGILEELGFEKYGNEVMYNGATGEQIPAAIFIGPVYGMRLKHMVEDKWNARGKGRKEVRTHQPTGGRGAQGGLKIGEMDRDAIIAHGGMSFVKESFMERSDGAKIPLCVACGTIPIYNPRLGIAICALCDGPVKYIGDTVNNLEILPPLGRPKSKIVEVEMPYSTKLLSQEQETYLNLTMRYITTSGVTRLKPLEYSGTSSEVIKELPRLILPETRVPAYIEEVPQAVLTVEQLRTMGTQLATMTEQERAVLDTVLDESSEGIDLEQAAQMNAMAQLQNGMTPTIPQNEIIMPSNQALPLTSEGMPIIAEGSEMPFAQTSALAAVPSAAPIAAVPVAAVPTVGGMPPPNLSNNIIPGQRPLVENEGFINGPQVPGTGPVIAIRTDAEAMMADGIMPGGFGRAPRRASYRGFGGGMNMNPMMPSVSRYTPMEGGSAMPSSVSSGAPITITKLE